jgi:hypothetical protein
VYKSRGFAIKMVHADEEFTSMRDKLMELDGIKERNCANLDGLPFKHYPKVLKVEMIKNADIWLNMFQHAHGISETMSPRTIMTGMRANFATHCCSLFGAYCEVHNENDPSNTMRPRTSQAIALNPTGNLQGSYYFMSLGTGKRISQHCWTELPFTQEVIDRLHAIALMEAAYDADVPDFQFDWGENDPINHQEDDPNETDETDDTDEPEPPLLRRRSARRPQRRSV